MWPMPASKGAKVHFLQHYEVFPNIPKDRVDAVWRLPTSKIAVAQWLVDLGRERFGINDIALAPNSIEEQFFHTVDRTKRHPPTVGFLYHIADFKDIPTTLRVIRRLNELRPDVRLVSFGAVVPKGGELPANVEFHHLPTEEKIAAVYASCDAWLSTSRIEGFNLPPLEAMASGCPAVCAKTGRPLEIIKDGINGYLVDGGDVNGFVNALATILSLSDRSWRDMSKAARRAVVRPTWEESNDVFEGALIRSLTDR
jgi:glycosyltransferase involved in cell wall biosynthesis